MLHELIPENNPCGERDIPSTTEKDFAVYY